jgi:AcrR family transcriptional regulator
MAGGKRGSGQRSGTPRGELTRIDEQRERRAEETVGRILEAMLVACGERGYRRVAVQDVIDLYGGNRVQFYRHFSSKADCYSAAYEDAGNRLCDRVLAAGAAAESWRHGIRAALDDLAGFAGAHTSLARGLVVEVQVAGGASLLRRAEALDRFERALDRAREESDPHRLPPTLTAAFLVGAVESALSTALAAGEPEAFAAAVPELTHTIVSTYLGEDAAAEELAATAA